MLQRNFLRKHLKKTPLSKGNLNDSTLRKLFTQAKKDIDSTPIVPNLTLKRTHPQELSDNEKTTSRFSGSN